MNIGTVKFFNEQKGYGFIKDNATGNEVFLHITGLVDKVKENDTVSYEVTQGKKGENAVNVKKV